jgi:hypothetical protein
MIFCVAFQHKATAISQKVLILARRRATLPAAWQSVASCKYPFNTLKPEMPTHNVLGHFQHFRRVEDEPVPAGLADALGLVGRLVEVLPNALLQTRKKTFRRILGSTVPPPYLDEQ